MLGIRVGTKDRRRSHRAGFNVDVAQGRRRAMGEVDVALLRADARGARQTLQISPRHAVDNLPDRRRRPSSMARARRISAFPTTTVCAPTRSRSRSRASSAISSAAIIETESEWAREEISRYMTATPCASCKGFRLKPEALAVKIDHAYRRDFASSPYARRASGSRRCRASSTQRATKSPGASSRKSSTG